MEAADTLLLAVHLNILSEYYLENKQFAEAFSNAKQSVDILANNDEKVTLAFSKLQLSRVYYEIGEITEAIQCAKESVFMLDSVGNYEGKIVAQYILSCYYWKCHDSEKAEKCLSEVLDFIKNLICDDIVEMTTEQKQRMWDKYERYFLLYRNIVEDFNKNEILLSKLYDYVIFSKSLLLDAEISQKHSKLPRLKVTWKDIQQCLTEQDIAIEFIATIENNGMYDNYHALIIDNTCLNPHIITLYSESDLDKIRQTDNLRICDIVGELIWKPILDQYPQVKNIYFSADKALHLLPIEYYNIDSGRMMFDNCNVHRLSSTKELITRKENQLLNSAVLYGNLEYNNLSANIEEHNTIMRGTSERGGFEPLYNTLGEIQGIRSLLSGKGITVISYLGENGTEESFKNLSGKNINLIHLATHGMYVNSTDVATKREEANFNFLESLMSENDPVKEDVTLTHSFLVMAGGNRLIQRETINENNDGILTAKEISQIDLTSLDLVVLSACESALGDLYNSGIYGLQRGFKKAGANTILMSLDKVDDEATKILMVEFYKNLMSGKSKHQSLKEAQKYLRKVDNGKYDDPKYWASFIMLDGTN